MGQISVLKNASDFSVKISGIHPKYKPTCLLIFYSSFIFMLSLLVSITTFYYLCLSQILTPGFITLTPLVLDTLLSQNVSLSPGSVSICSSPNEKFSRDLTPEIRPLLHAGQTSPLQPHPEQETCCSSCVSLNS